MSKCDRFKSKFPQRRKRSKAEVLKIKKKTKKQNNFFDNRLVKFKYTLRYRDLIGFYRTF